MEDTMKRINCPGRPANKRVVLVLQGGGALGAYQVGVYQALEEHGYAPDWVAGTSIGAINSALIAGNAPDQRLARLDAFWRGVSRAECWAVDEMPPKARKFLSQMSATRAMLAGVPDFFAPKWPALNLMAGGSARDVSFYETAQLRSTLKALINFQLVNEGSMRLSMSAVEVATGRPTYFDNRRQPIGPEHILASGALPPGFPAVEIDGKLYWDGGVYSNTPLEVVLEDEPRRDTLCFMVDLWNPVGPDPRNLAQVLTRHKDLTYSSRSLQHIKHYRAIHDLRNAVRFLHDLLPEEQQDDPTVAAVAALGCATTMNIVHLVYPQEDWELAYKDVDFSWPRIQERWQRGYADAARALKQAAWLEPVPAEVGVVVHEVTELTEAA
jgi:NTE family protein